MPCKLHPYYKGKRKPTRDCETCLEYYYEQNLENTLQESDGSEVITDIFESSNNQAMDNQEFDTPDESSMEDVPDENFADLEKEIDIRFMIDYMRSNNHFSKKHYANGIAPIEEMPDGLDYDADNNVATEEYLRRIAEYFYEASQEEWKDEVKIPYLIPFFLAEFETGFRTWVRGDNGKAYNLLQWRIEWHKDRTDITDRHGKSVKLKWNNDFDMIRMFFWNVSKSLSEKKSLKQSLSLWPNTRPKVLKNYNRYKD